MSLQPYTGTFGPDELRHLLRRTLFGATAADMDHFSGMSLAQVVNELLTFTNNTQPPIKAYTVPDGNMNPDPNLVDPDVPFGTTWTTIPRDPQLMNPNPNAFRAASFKGWWMGLLLGQERNIREKMVLFWHNHIATETGTVQLAESMYEWNQLLRDSCLGNFRSLMYDVSIHPAMLIYLNGYLNSSFAPDENYARELMELFTLGQGSGYTEDDVQAAARVLTGWSILLDNNGTPIIPTNTYIPFLHDTNDKQFSAFFSSTVISGQGGPNGGALELNQLLDMIFTKEEVSEFICRKLYRFFVHSDIDAAIEADVIEPLALIFRNNAGAPEQMKIVMEALLSSECFFSDPVRACMITTPVDFMVGTLRQFKMPYPDATQFEAQYRIWLDVYGILAFSGQELGDPPNVAGWPAYYQYPLYDQIWMDTATFALRKLIYEFVSFIGLSTPGNLYQPQSQNLEFKVDFMDVVGDFSAPEDPDVLVQEAAELLLPIPLSQTVRDQLKVNYLLFGQAVNYYWTQAYQTYEADPNTTDPSAQLVPFLLISLFLDLQGAAEHQLF